jgi:PAS domain S-box-containing protein
VAAAPQNAVASIFRDDLMTVSDTPSAPSSQHALQQALLDAQSRAGIGLFIIDGNRILFANDAVCRMCGYSEAEMLAMPDFIVLAQPAYRDQIRRNAMRRVAGEQFGNTYEVGILTRDGGGREAQVTVVPMPSEQGVRLLVIIVDVTERKLAQDAHQRSEVMLREIVEGTSRAVGAEFFRALVRHLARALGVPVVLVGEVRPAHPTKLHSLALWTGEGFGPDIDYDLAASPCGRVYGGDACLFDGDLAARFPEARCMIEQVGVESYFGYPLTAANGEPLGVLAIMDREKMMPSEARTSLMAIFATRAAAELERLRAEAEIHKLNTELEARVQQRTAELSEVNQELETFAYSISHDLRAPLRGIDGFSRLQEEYGDRLDEQGSEYLVRVRRAAQRLGTLIDDLLELSRVSRHEMRRHRVDVSAIAVDIADDLRQSEPERNVTVRIEPHCMADGDPQLLRVLLENLIGNAWKYSRNTEKACIEFGRNAEGFFVRDNGAGFDMAYAEKLFMPFQRLHNPAEFEGSGIGLASAARVVRRHGGRIWAEGKPGCGAVFHFTL